MSSGIYKITNLINNKFYIGSSYNIERRKNVHFRELNNNIHQNNHLQSSYNKYGKENFYFEILVYTPKEYVLNLEKWFIDTLKPEYNKTTINNVFHNIISEESKIKLRNTIKTNIENGSRKYPTIQLDLYEYEQYIKRFNSFKDLSVYIGTTSANITKYLNYRKKEGLFRNRYKIVKLGYINKKVKQLKRNYSYLYNLYTRQKILIQESKSMQELSEYTKIPYSTLARQIRNNFQNNYIIQKIK